MREERTMTAENRGWPGCGEGKRPDRRSRKVRTARTGARQAAPEHEGVTGELRPLIRTHAARPTTSSAVLASVPR